MIAFVVLFFAVLWRLVPVFAHVTALNISAVGGSLLFFGARRPRWQLVIAVVAFAATDILLTVYGYHHAFHVRGYLVTWVWYGAICLFGHRILQRVTAGRIVAGVAGSATSFFLLSNFMVWTGHMYAHNLAGLGACYTAAIPFYRNDLVSTALVAGVLFGVPLLIARTSPEHIRETAV